MSPSKFRLVTRSDFDGLVCAVLLNELGMIDDIKFVHPKDMQDGKIDITSRDITTNLPYVAGVIWPSTTTSPKPFAIPASAPTTSSRPMRLRRHAWCTTITVAPRPFPTSADMMLAVDKADSAQFTRRGNPQSQGLGAAELPDGFAHRPGALPRVPRQQLPVDDGPDPVLPQPRHCGYSEIA
jgi:hypothetical protein